MNEKRKSNLSGKDVSDLVPWIGGWLAIAVGLIVITGWYAHWVAVIQMVPNLPPMQFNTALGFVLTGAGLLLLIRARFGMARVLGLIVAGIGLLSLGEYVFGVDFGIDQIFIKAYLYAPGASPGRMSPLTGICFGLLGWTLAMAGHDRLKLRLTAIALGSCTAMVITCVACGGYALNIETAYGWGVSTRMALHTAPTFLFLSAGFLVWAWRQAARANISFLRWLPVTASLTLMAMIALTSLSSFDQLKVSSDWRRHSFDVLDTAETFLGQLFDTNRGMRAYVLSGQQGGLRSYQEGVRTAPQELDRLAVLVSDNPPQEERVKALRTDYAALVDYADRLIALRDAQGVQAAVQVEASGRGFTLADRTIVDLRLFLDEERRLLNERSAAAAENFKNTVRVLGLGSAVAAVLLILSSWMASREVSFRRRAEVRLGEVASMQKAILDSANHAIVSVNMDGIVTSFNETAERWLGYSPEEIIGKVTPVIWRDPQEVAEQIEESSREQGRPVSSFEALVGKVSPGKSDEHEWTFIRKDGSRFPVWLSVSVLSDEAGRTVGYLGVIADISARKKMEQELETNRLRLDGILKNSLDGILAYDAIRDEKGAIRDFQFTLVNPAAERLSGKPASELKGHRLSEIFPDVMRDGVLEKFIQIVETGESQDFEHFTKRDGQSQWLRIAGAKLDDGLSVSYMDISDRKHAEAVLHEKNIDLENAAQAKNAFLANMSHELRTPLNGIIGFSEILADGVAGEVNAEQKEYLGDILNSGQHLLQLINDVLDLAKVEAGKMELHPETFSLRTAIEQVCSVAYPLVQKKKIQLVTTIDPTVNEITLDQQKLKQVLYNLLSNAIKFTGERGRVEIAIARLGVDRFTLAVSDTGIGIRPENIKRLFKEFEQLDEGATRRYQGTGLGLALTRKIVEMQGGAIRVESEFGKGAVFTATLPLVLEEVPS